MNNTKVVVVVLSTFLFWSVIHASVPNCDAIAPNIQGYLIDLDGTMYDPQGLSNGALPFYQWLTSTDRPFVFLSNTGTKGPLGTQIKFLTPPFNISVKPVPLQKIYTATSATANFLADHAPSGSRMYLLQGTASFGNNKHDSCHKVLARTVKKEIFESWDIRTDMTAEEVKLWAASISETPTFVVLCDDGKLEDDVGGDPTTHRKGYSDWSFSLLERANWLIRNGATFVSSAPDSQNAGSDPQFPTLNLNTPGPGVFQKLLVAATYPVGINRTFIVGKGGNMGTKYMIEHGLAMLQALLPPGSAALDRSKVVMVGDVLTTDIKAANLAGISSVLVTQTGVNKLIDLPYFPDIVPTCAVDNIGCLVVKA